MNSSTDTTKRMSPADKSKFLFDLSFDDSLSPSSVEKHAEPSAPAAEPTFTLTLQELDAIKEAARQDGVDEGRRAAESGQATRLTMLNASIETQLQTISNKVGEMSAGQRETIVTAIKAIAQNVLPTYLSHHGFAEIEELVTRCLVDLKEEPRLVIRVHESQLQESIARFEKLAVQAAFPGQLIILDDKSLGEGDCRIEWADGGLDRTMDTLWKEIEQNLSRALASRSSTGTHHYNEIASMAPDISKALDMAAPNHTSIENKGEIV